MAAAARRSFIPRVLGTRQVQTGRVVTLVAGRSAPPPPLTTHITRRPLSTTPPTTTRHAFQAETTKLLNIVSKSLYSEREVFLRELVSNASDACEKFRHATVAGVVDGSSIPLAIKIETDDKENTLTVRDMGIGMSKDEMMSFLGTIGKSGTEALSKDKKEFIGQFGVGFYSLFMVANKVEVTSRPAVGADQTPHVWRSDGTDTFELTTADNNDIERGTSVKIFLKDEAREFSNAEKSRQVLERYSNFVSFPLYVNNEQVNTIGAVWTLDPATVTEEQHTSFFKFMTNAFDAPIAHLHYRTDAPLDIKALLYIPKHHEEHPGMPRALPGVSLYSRRVLLVKNHPEFMPQWTRFVKGVVDSEDIPMSISRETSQDKRVVQKLATAVTKRFIRFLKERATQDPKWYAGFFKSFGVYIKEGICTDYLNQADLSKLLRFDTSFLKPGEDLASLDEVISRSKAGQKQIYYLSAPNRAAAEASPYFEVFRKAKVEVVFIYTTLDDFCMSNLRTYETRDLVPAESGGLDPELLKADGPSTTGSETANATESTTEASTTTKLDKKQVEDLCLWVSQELKDLVINVAPTQRLGSSPAIVVDHESAALRRMMKMVGAQDNVDGQRKDDLASKQRLEINPSHPMIITLDRLTRSKPDLAKQLARHVFDSAMIAAGVVDDPRDMVPRMNALLCRLLENEGGGVSPPVQNVVEEHKSV